MIPARQISRSAATTPGGPTWVRRAVLVVASATLAGVLLSTVPAASQSRPGTEEHAQVSLHESEGLYRVAAEFLVAAPIGTARDVLTDYEAIPRFLPNVRTSTVRERTPGRTVVEQEAVAKVMMFSRRIHLVLEIEESPGRIAFRDLCGQSFDRYEGAWVLSETHSGSDPGVLIAYALTARPSTGIPAFFVRRLLEGDVKNTIRRLQIEMSTRAARDRRAGPAARRPSPPAAE